ncbi:MAG TPA: GGDEF domain-containing protein [Candidatus Aquicultor sp.]|jgi:diguanylate cyclase (GGDEF)-like protein
MESITTMNTAAEEFRDNIWMIVESWMEQLAGRDGDYSWKRLPETQLIDNLPTLLRGISKVIENPGRITDFEPDGIINNVATELGKNRRQYNYKASEVLYEQELLRDIIWQFCQKNVTAPDFYELEQRINRPLSKLTSTITDSYIAMYKAELKYLARYDKLTGFLNYESFKQAIGGELKRSRRYRHQCTLILVDIDGFSDYAEIYGHDESNSLIQSMAEVISHVIRNVDIPVRYSTDEFAILLPETPKKQARKVAERLRKVVKTETRHLAEVRGILKTAVTVSAGLATYPKDAETADGIISLADEALDEAKKSGSDIVMWK